MPEISDGIAYKDGLAYKDERQSAEPTDVPDIALVGFIDSHKEPRDPSPRWLSARGEQRGDESLLLIAQLHQFSDVMRPATGRPGCRARH
jgi:hypothetical protein